MHIILKSIKCVMHKSEFIPCKADVLDSKYRKKPKKIAQKTLQGTVNIFKCAVPSTTFLSAITTRTAHPFGLSPSLYRIPPVLLPPLRFQNPKDCLPCSLHRPTSRSSSL
jgi:hypothetical protein